VRGPQLLTALVFELTKRRKFAGVDEKQNVCPADNFFSDADPGLLFFYTGIFLTSQ